MLLGVVVLFGLSAAAGTGVVFAGSIGIWVLVGWQANNTSRKRSLLIAGAYHKKAALVQAVLSEELSKADALIKA